MGVLKHGRLFAAMGAAMFLLAMFAILGPLRPVELLQDDKSTQYYFGPVFRSRKIPVIPADSGPLSRLAARTVADTLAEALPDIQVELRELQDSAPVPPPEPLAGVEPLLVACSDSPLFPEDHTPPQSVVAVRLDTLDRALSHHCRAWPFAASSVNGIYFHGARLAGSGVLMRNRAVRQAARKLAGEFLQAWRVPPDTVCDLTEELQAFAAPENRFGELGGQLLLAGSDPTRSCFEIRRSPLTGCSATASSRSNAGTVPATTWRRVMKSTSRVATGFRRGCTCRTGRVPGRRKGVSAFRWIVRCSTSAKSPPPSLPRRP